MKHMKRQKIKAIAVILLFMMVISGCGSAGQSEQAVETGDSASDEKAGNKTDEKEDTADFPEKLSEFQYIEATEIEDYYGDKSMYKIYVPRDSSNEEGYISYYDHGLSFFASVHNYEFEEYLLETLEASVKFTTDELTADNSEYTDVEIGDVLKNGEDFYQIIKARKEDLFGLIYEVNYIYYMDVQDNGAGVLWDLELHETGTDAETDRILDELAVCYDIDLDVIKASGEWAVASEEYFDRIEAEEAEKQEGKEEIKAHKEDLETKEKKETKESLPETILWFNASYAPQTYNNRCDWMLVGGAELSRSTQEFRKSGLESSWGIEDRASALETVEDLKENGHRAKCRECMEELEKLGILGERNEEKLTRALQDAGIRERLYRYVLANQMYRSGLDADYIAAWDLCRANYLYADFYLCGYMTYEEAMDASLENSVILQQMYSSWDDMVVAYLIGYQFWQSDPMSTDDSPTTERYQCYLDLLEMEDGPYTLDWDMELQKSW